MEHAAIQELLGAFAVHALDDTETVKLEEHLETCDECQLELDQHVNALSHLNPPEDTEGLGPLWNKISASIDAQAQAPAEQAPSVVSLDERRNRATSRSYSPWLASIAAIVAVVMGVGLLLQARTIDTLTSDIDALEAAASDPVALAAAEAQQTPGAISVALTSDAGSQTVEVILQPDGTGFVTASTLAALPADRTYQLWAIVNDEVLSAGVLGQDPTVVPFRIDPEGLQGFAVTEEVAGGVAVSQNAPAAVWLQEA